MNLFSKISLLLLWTLPTILYGQIRGEYCHDYGFPTKCFRFLDNSKFEYGFHHAKGLEKGKGIYFLKDSLLTFNFITDTSYTNLSYIQTEKSETSAGEIEIEFKVYEKLSKDPIVYCPISMKRNSKFSGGQTDLSGTASFKILKSTDSTIIQIHSLGYLRFFYAIQNDKNYKFSVYLAQEQGKVLGSGDTLFFKVKNLKNESLELKQTSENNLWDYETFFKY